MIKQITSTIKAVFGAPATPARSSIVGMTRSDLSWNQILDYVNSSGDAELLDLYGVGYGGGLRHSALSFGTLYRIVTLLSSIASQQITSGNLRILDSDNRIVKSRYAKNIENKFISSVDGGMTPSFSWFEDWITEYLLDGNALAHVQTGPNNSFGYLERLTSYDAECVLARDGIDFVYRARLADSDTGEYRYYGKSRIAHARWPRLRRIAAGASARSRFATAPVYVLRPAIEIGLLSDKFIRNWYIEGGSHRSQLGISFMQPLTPEQRSEISEYLANQARGTREPIVMGQGATYTNLQNNAATNTQTELRKFQVEELGRIYGVPAPILNDNITQWGGGIETLVKMFWRFGARQHIERLIAPLAMILLRPGHKFSIDDTDILRGDAAAISALITATSGDSQRQQIATREEARRWAGLPLEPEHGEFVEPMREQPPPPTPPDSNDDDGAADQAAQ